MIKSNYKILIRLLITLAVFGSSVNFALAQQSPFGDSTDSTAPNLGSIQFLPDNATQQNIIDQLPDISLSEQAKETVLNTVSFEFSQEEVRKGKKVKAFDDKFVFQIDKKILNSPATLNLKEIILQPGSLMAAPDGFQLASRVYEFDYVGAGTDLKKAVWFSIKYDSSDYFRKNLYYFDDATGKWAGIKGIISNTASKIVANVSMAKARVAILEDIDIMTEGYASWYKYKGCNCAASPDYPKGTKLKVTNVQNGKSVTVKVNDWGPDRSVFPNRVIDLDVVAFKQIASKSAGLCQVKVEPVSVVETTVKK
ncbi:MAG: septal ring lytic transglycosylase RlpA family protein [Patescibacteria group bacterium]|nr:septal ring lytic transglycosylase RlpA family protein [Patescibacteria group bacterium]